MINLGTSTMQDFALGDNLVERIDLGDTTIFDPYNTLTGTLPLSFNSRVAGALKNYRIYGTSAGSGTPTESGEPAGYKIPISLSDGTSTSNYDLMIGDTKLYEDEYLDFVEQKVYKQIALSEPLRAIGEYKDTLDLSTGIITRHIKEVVLPDEQYRITKNGASSSNYLYYFRVGGNNRIDNDEVICSHLPCTSTPPQTVIGACGGTAYNAIYLNLGADIMNAQSSGNTATGFTEYMTSEANNNTPITIWYILKTPITETITVPAGLSGTVEGYLIQDGTPAPTNPIYPTANDIVLQPTDPPAPLPAIQTYQGENTLSSTETLGEVSVKGRISEVQNG